MKKFFKSSLFEIISFTSVIILSLVIILGNFFDFVPHAVSSVIYCIMLAVLCFIFVFVPFLFSSTVKNRKLFYITMFVRLALCFALLINWFWPMNSTIFDIISPMVLFCIILIIAVFLLGNKYDKNKAKSDPQKAELSDEFLNTSNNSKSDFNLDINDDIDYDNLDEAVKKINDELSDIDI